MESEQLISTGSGSGSGSGSRYVQMRSEQLMSPSSLFSFRHSSFEPARIFDELPSATIVSVSRPDAGDISPMLLSYTIEFQYKQARSLSLLLFLMDSMDEIGLHATGLIIVSSLAFAAKIEFRSCKLFFL